MIELRAHHLLCVLTFAGRGYSPNFVARFEEVAQALNRGERIRIVSGPDTLCACVIAEDPRPHCYKTSVAIRDIQAAKDLGIKLGISLQPGTVIELSRERLTSMRDGFRSGDIRRACAGCQWHALCTDLADTHFMDCRVAAHAELIPESGLE